MSLIATSVLGLVGTGWFVGASDADAMPHPAVEAAGHPARTAATVAKSLVARMPATKGAPTPQLAYDLAESDGTVTALGGAAYFGSEYGKQLPAPIVALVATPDRGGYWLIGADASVYPFGDAKNEGGAAGKALSASVVAAAATPDGGGYWLVTATGQVLPFGDAKNYGSITSPLKDHVVGIVATTNGKGYWIACSTGGVFSFGDASFHGSIGARHIGGPMVAMAATPDDGGYWLAESNGDVFRFGDAVRLAPPSQVNAKSPVVGISVTPDGTGDWLAEQDGTVLNFGTATSHGSLTGVPPTSPVVAIAAMPMTHVQRLKYPRGGFGYDINWPQCAGPTSPKTIPLPGPPSHPAGTISYTVAVVGVDGWAVGADNPCLRAEASWARNAKATDGAPYDLYMFLNSPSSSDTIDQEGPAGTCADFSSTKRATCLAYNYGYNSAQIATEYATSHGASSPMWWLDIENDLCGQYWSCDPALNSLTIQGSIDFLHAQELTVGVYSTSVQWQGITGGYVPSGPQIPIWVAGAYWTSPPYPSSYGYLPPSKLAPFCGAKYAFAGGKTWLLQETPGPNDYPFDPDYAC